MFYYVGALVPFGILLVSRRGFTDIADAKTFCDQYENFQIFSETEVKLTKLKVVRFPLDSKPADPLPEYTFRLTFDVKAEGPEPWTALISLLNQLDEPQEKLTITLAEVYNRRPIDATPTPTPRTAGPGSKDNVEESQRSSLPGSRDRTAKRERVDHQELPDRRSGNEPGLSNPSGNGRPTP